MTNLTKTDQKVLKAAREWGGEFTPTEIGMKLGHEQCRASSKMAPHFKRLAEMDLISRREEGHNRVFYKATDVT